MDAIVENKQQQLKIWNIFDFPKSSGLGQNLGLYKIKAFWFIVMYRPVHEEHDLIEWGRRLQKKK